MMHTRPAKRIPRSSPFARFRELPRLGREFRTMHDGVDMFEYDPARRLFSDVDLPADHPAAPHMGLAHNDGIILDARVQQDCFTLTFSHHGVGCLAASYSEDGDWNDFCRLFPITLRFEGLFEFRLVRLVEQGALQCLRTCQADLEDRFFDIGNLRVLEYEPTGITALLKLRPSFAKKEFERFERATLHVLTDENYVCVRAGELAVEEAHREAWLRIFGRDAMWVLDRYESVAPVPLWGGDDYERFLHEIGAR